MKTARKESFWKSLNPHSLVAIGFGVAILIGTALLMLPAAAGDGQPLRLVDAVFTATSAICVNGLTVVNVGTRLSLFGQMTLLALVQLGGVGITTLGTFMLVLAGRRLSVQGEFVLMDAYGVGGVKGIRALLIWAVALTLLFEGAGAALLYWRYHVLGVEQGVHAGTLGTLYYAVFHSINAFCNAGFSLHADSLCRFQQDPFYLPIAGALAVVGGLGFLTLYNLITIKFWQRDLRSRGRISLHTKIVLTATVILIAAGTALLLLDEWGHALKDLPVAYKINCALFQAVTPRSAGLNAVPMAQLSESSRYVTGILMLIGGSPGSAAGGIKTTTLMVLVMTVYAMCKRRKETIIFSRTMTHTVVREAIVIFLLALALIAVAYGVLLWTEFPHPEGDHASRLLFETISASATVGLSIDSTPLLSTAGRWVIIFCMYVGRLGPLAVALLISKDQEHLHIRYPEEEVVVG